MTTSLADLGWLLLGLILTLSAATLVYGGIYMVVR